MNPFKVYGKFNLIKLLVSVAIPEGVGILSRVLTSNQMEVYKKLEQPPFAPPSWVFGVVWPILYLLMGLAAYRIWMHKSQGVDTKDALFYYYAQLVFNFIWSILFFRLGLRGLALVDLIILLIFVIITTVKFYRVDKLSGWLMIPYIIWLIYATFLNLAVWLLNR